MDLLSAPVVFGALLALVVGATLGLLGGGGSILTVPILVYVVGLDAHEAIALSLLVVGVTSVAALVGHARAGRVRFQVGLVFGATSMIGAYGAGQVAHLLPATFLLVAFGVMMLVTAVAMMRRGGSGDENVERVEPRLPILAIVAEGLVVGALTGLVGAGGGFVVVPALVLLGKLPMRTAVGTSLLVIAMNSFAAFAGHAASVSIDWPLAVVLTGAAVVGSVAGSAFASRVPQAMLKRGFAWLVVVMSLFVLMHELPHALGARVELAWPLVLAVCALPAGAGVLDLLRLRRTSVAPLLVRAGAHES